MARFPALALVCEAVAQLLADSHLSEEFPGAEYPVIGAATLANLGSPTPAKVPSRGVSVFPYRVSNNVQRRPTQPRVTSDGARFRPSLLVDLHLLISAWASSGTEQMRLLAWAARTLEDTPLLGAGILNRTAPGEEVFGSSESVELVAEPLGQADLVAIWEINKALMQPSLGFVARMIALDSEVPVPDGGLVRSRNFAVGVLSP